MGERLSTASSDFATEEVDQCLLMDRLARRYGGAPSDWRRRSLEDLSFDRLCLELAEQDAADFRRRLPPHSIQLTMDVG